RLLDAEVIEQALGVQRHLVREIELRVVQLARGAVAAIVEGDGLVARLDQRRHPAGVDPVHLAGRTEAVDQQDWLSSPVHLVGDFDSVRKKARHGYIPSQRSRSSSYGPPPKPGRCRATRTLCR